MDSKAIATPQPPAQPPTQPPTQAPHPTTNHPPIHQLDKYVKDRFRCRPEKHSKLNLAEKKEEEEEGGGGGGGGRGGERGGGGGES